MLTYIFLGKTMKTKNTHPASPSKRVQQTRRRILQAASQEFSSRGFSGATTQSIASRAGVNELTLFRHFQSKKNLFLEVIAHYSAMPDIQNTLKQHLSGDLRQDMLLIASRTYQILQERSRHIITTLHEAQLFPEVRQVSAQMQWQQTAMLADYLDRQMQRGALRKLEPQLAAQAFMGMLFSYAIQQSLSDTALDESEHVITSFVDIFLSGLQLS